MLELPNKLQLRAESDSDINTLVEGSASLMQKAPSAYVINNKSHAGQKIK